MIPDVKLSKNCSVWERGTSSCSVFSTFCQRWLTPQQRKIFSARISTQSITSGTNRGDRPARLQTTATSRQMLDKTRAATSQPCCPCMLYVETKMLGFVRQTMPHFSQHVRCHTARLINRDAHETFSQHAPATLSRGPGFPFHLFFLFLHSFTNVMLRGVHCITRVAILPRESSPVSDSTFPVLIEPSLDSMRLELWPSHSLIPPCYNIQ